MLVLVYGTPRNYLLNPLWIKICTWLLNTLQGRSWEWNFYLHTVSRSRYISSYTIISKNVQEITIIRVQTKTRIKINGLWIIHCVVLSYKWYTLDWKHTEKCKLQQSGLQGLISWHSDYKIPLTQRVHLLQNSVRISHHLWMGCLNHFSETASAMLWLIITKDVYKKPSLQD